MKKSLDAKLVSILQNSSSNEFILADAKDADMAFGIRCTGQDPEDHGSETRYRSLSRWQEIIREIVAQAKIDIMLMSASTSKALTIKDRIFDKSSVTPAVRVNDSTDIHIIRGSNYSSQPSRPFRSTTLDHIQAGKLDPSEQERASGANLGLYSMTLNNDIVFDLQSLQAFRDFRFEAERKNFKYFLEIFIPNVKDAVDTDQIGHFINDHIVRILAGVPDNARPRFLKIPFLGPKYLEELVNYDPTLVPGIMGGSSGTTFDAFKMLAEAKKAGARVALFGRKINNAEHQLAFISCLRWVADGETTPEEGVKLYHAELERLQIKPYRSLEKDLELSNPIMRYLL
ncbi:hypothetical protein GF406_07915 [candidate division KSB1 bacterium]|jgi:hypothetical protein|nr:hypothetical protein [candidate division KSB1 bacterium]